VLVSVIVTHTKRSTPSQYHAVNPRTLQKRQCATASHLKCGVKICRRSHGALGSTNATDLVTVFSEQNDFASTSSGVRFKFTWKVCSQAQAPSPSRLKGNSTAILKKPRRQMNHSKPHAWVGFGDLLASDKGPGSPEAQCLVTVSLRGLS
jgi:hypothetical protein